MSYPRWSTAALVLGCLAAFVYSSRPALPAIKGAAPADEYFGKMKMSYLGIDNSLRDAYIMAGEHTTYPQIIQKVFWAENALLDWQHRYPNDPQLPRSLFFLAGAYLKIWTSDGQSHALLYVSELRDRYGSTYFGKLIKADLAKGLTLHVFAAAQPCAPIADEPTPTPAPMPTSDPKHNIRVQEETAACFTPPPTSTPLPVATLAPAGSAPPAAGAHSPAPGASAVPVLPSPAGSAQPVSSPSTAPSGTPTATPPR
jgi:hypothetical protein